MEHKRYVIKKENLFFVYGEGGNVDLRKIEGLFYKDMRYLSSYEVALDGKRLNGVVENGTDRYRIAYHVDTGFTLSIERMLSQDTLLEYITVENQTALPQVSVLSFHFALNFEDLFVVRGFADGDRGNATGNVLCDGGFKVTYQGIDGIARRMQYDGAGALNSDNSIEYKIDRKQLGIQTFKQAWHLSEGEQGDITKDSKVKAWEALTAASPQREVKSGGIHSDDIKTLVEQALRDIDFLTMVHRGKRYIAAGVPCFATLFGRDSIIAGLQLIGRKPELLKETLLLLAEFQGKEVNPELEEEPGKILHELRLGELANTRQVPFYPYYGSIDSTPLFLIGCAEYFTRTKDRAFLDAVMPAVEKALAWIDTFGDRDGDGYVEYLQLSPRGFNNHGWKDSGDSVVHADGRLAQGAIALAEVQGYVYKAKMDWGSLLYAEGNFEKGKKLLAEAELLRARYNRDFYINGYFALGLDGNKNRIESVTSNPLHGLFCGIIEDDYIPVIVGRAFQEDLFSEYGIRTMSSLEKAYDPLSYHNGSIWPHDNSLIALGLARYGYKEEAEKLAKSIFEAGKHMESCRMPELYGGEGLATYEEACIPQGWAAGSIVLLNDILTGAYYG